MLTLQAGGASAQATRADAARRTVLVLNGADAELPVFVVANHELREEIRAAFGEENNVYAESLDLLRFPPEQIEAELEALLRRKYAGIRIDVVAAFGGLGRVFAERHVDALWPGAAIVYFGEPTLAGIKPARGSRTAGVSQEFDITGTIALALRLLPATRRIVVVGGSSQSDRAMIGMAREGLGRFEGGLAIDYLAGRSLPETLARVKDLAPGSVVLFLTMSRDGAGVPHRGVEMAQAHSLDAELILRASTAPPPRGGRR